MKINEIVNNYIGNCINSFDPETGECVNQELPWRDTTDFAQAVENMTSSSEIIDGIRVDYDDNTDIHWFAIG